MNIIFVTISMVGGGTERVISVLANHAASLGQKVTIMMIADDRVEYKLDDRINVICVSKATGGSLIGRLKRLSAMRKVIKESDGAGVIAMGSSAGLFTLLATMGLENPVVVSERNPPNRLNLKPISRPMKFIREFLYSRASKVVLQTEDSKECFGSKAVANATTIMNPLTDDIFSYDTSGEREYTILSAGRFVDYKAFDFLIDSFAEFSKTHPEYKLKIFGKGDLEDELKAQIDGLGLNDKALMCGFSNDLYSELIKGGMFVSPSRLEGISNALMEALALGIPVIATDCPVGGSRMCIENNVNGILVPVDDKEAMVKAMCKVADDREFRDSIVSKAKERSHDWAVDAIWKQWMAQLTVRRK
ncbi:MAG: glycosyltransferase [Lachnospiraceae bacterium]|nr:glycosyltransferase [Lachnospiraceae bacterium]